eukprot:6032731-Prymnesium_polylepis.1
MHFLLHLRHPSVPSASGDLAFLWAQGSRDHASYHGSTNRGAFLLNLQGSPSVTAEDSVGEC